MKKIAALVFAMISIAMFSACNTMQGVGRDIEKGGQAIERAAK